MTNNTIYGMIFLGHGEYSIIEFLFVEFQENNRENRMG